MNDLPIPPHGFDTKNKWGAALQSILDGNVIFFPNVPQTLAVGVMKRAWIREQGFVVRTQTGGRSGDRGTYAWIARKGAK